MAVCLYSRKQHSNKKNQVTSTHNNMDEPHIYNVEWKKPDKKEYMYAWFCLY